MTCTQCSKAVERGLSRLGYESVSVSLATHTARIGNSSGPIDEETVKETIECLGYEVTSYETISSSIQNGANADPTATVAAPHLVDTVHGYQERQDAELKALKKSFWIAFLLMLPIFIGGMIPFDISRDVLFLGVGWDQWVTGLLATLVQFGCGWDFYRRTWYNPTGMHVLIALGTTAAYLFAFFQLLVSHKQRAEWDTAPMLITFVRGGQWMQALAVQRTRLGLEKLMELQARTAIRVMNPDGKDLMVDPYQEEVAPIEEVSVGDVVKIIRGASVPVDGRIIFGEISVDESMVTGESIPILKTKGAIVIGGTICAEGVAFVQVQATGSSSALSQIVQIVQDAQSRSVPVQSLADEVAAVFVPAVCMFAMITYLVW